MASDISAHLSSELKNTFESLLSLTASIDGTSQSSLEDVGSQRVIRIVLSLSSNDVSGTISFIIPTLLGTKVEYFMLGMGELKTSIDEDIFDATKEIINTVAGSLATSINAQGFDDLSGVSFSPKEDETQILESDDLGDITNLYRVEMTFNDEDLELFVAFSDDLVPFMGKIVSGEVIEDDDEEDVQSATSGGSSGGGGASSILALLGAESTENLKLLFNVKLKFSVRLGTKTFLLKDIVNWDIGHIIELEQMVNEPLDILVNGTKVGEGEAVIVEGRFGIKIKHIGEKQIEV